MHDISKILSVAVVIGLMAISVLPNEPPKLVDITQPVGILEIDLKAKPREFFSHGSGVFITPTRFLTAAHVVNKVKNNPAVSARVRTEDGSLYSVTDVSLDADHDIAYVTLDRPYKGYIPEISCEAQPRGTYLTTMGNPLQMEFVEVEVRVAGGRPPTYIPTSVTEQENKKPKLRKPEDISPQKETGKFARPDQMIGQEFFQGISLPGQSGSPMFTRDNKVVGVLSISILESQIGSFTGLGLYVKTSSACSFLEEAVGHKLSK